MENSQGKLCSRKKLEQPMSNGCETGNFGYSVFSVFPDSDSQSTFLSLGLALLMGLRLTLMAS